MDISNVLKKTIIFGLLAVAVITPFIISSSLFFPYITGKNFFFRIIVEILAAIWVVLALIDRRYRPVSSPLVYAMGTLLAVLILSTIFSVNPYRSFWSNYERMEGLIGHLHLFAYFLILISVFKTEKNWRTFFYGVSFGGAAMALYGYLQSFGFAVISQQSGPRIDGTFGNASYMAIFMVFQVFLAGYLALASDKRWQKILFATLFAAEVPVVFLTATRGAILGMMGGFLLFSILFGLFSKEKKIRIAALSIIGGMIVLVAAFWMARNASFVRESYIFDRFRNLSFRERTIESRFTIWRMSWEGVKARPILGWGLENYNQVFNKYYNPILWRQEPWFDRSHNVVFDWMIAGGFLGLAAYASIFGSALYILWKRCIRERFEKRSFSEAAIFTSLFGAYFFHNLFVFDNLTSYYFFFTILGYVHYRDVEGQAVMNGGMRALPLSGRMFASSPRLLVGTAFAAAALVFSLYFLSIKPYMASRGILDALRGLSAYGRQTDRVLEQFEKVFSYHTFGTGEAREQLASYANSVVSSDLAQADKIKVWTVAVKEMEKQVKDAPDDARTWAVLGGLYGVGGRYEDALEAVERALELSPQKQQFYFILADIYLTTGQADMALKKLQFAYDLDQTNGSALLNLALVAVLNGRSAYADEVLTQFYGTPIVPEKRLITAYARVGNYRRAAELWQKVIEAEPQNMQNRVSLSAAYVQLGDRARAIATLEEAAAVDPTFQDQADMLIRDIRAGRNPQ